jgi:hypothetical protein
MTAGKLRTGQRVDMKEGCLDLIDRGSDLGNHECNALIGIISTCSAV